MRCVKEKKTVLVQTVDHDVLVILIANFSLFDSLSQGFEIFIRFGHVKHNQILNVRELGFAFGAQRCTALSLWVFLTGCDSTSSMRGRSKRTAFSAGNKSGDVTTQAMVELMQQPFMTLRLDSVQFRVLEASFITLYGGGAESINKQCQMIFCQRNQNPELIPPTQNALFHHFQRELYQASMRGSAKCY